MSKLDSARDPRTNPARRDELGYRDKPKRKVTVTFVDACGTPCVWYQTEHCLTLKQWRRWARYAEVQHASLEDGK